ncbi:MAG: N-acetylmuramoyl-L-alanine amidase [Desulfuromonas sp.]|nr:MAG: N-acetylmuramoyl-L-alanine amidase [Desulfuromonas sp.]
MMKRCLIFMLILLLPALVWADASERAYGAARDSYYKLKKSQKERLYRHNWEKVVDQFERVQNNYAQGEKGDDALFMAAKTTYELYAVSGLKDDAAGAASIFDRVPELYPESSLADDALEFSAKIHETVLDDLEGAYARYRRIVTIYPQGDMVRQAKSKTAALARYAPDRIVSKPPPSSKKDGRTSLDTIRFWSNPGYTRVVLEVGSVTEFTSNFLKGDPAKGEASRIYVDLAGTVPAEKLDSSRDVNDGLLTRIRAGQPDSETTRVVLDLESFGDYKVFPLAEPARIVIDVHGAKQAELSATEEQLTAAPSGDDDIAGLLSSAPKERPLKVHIPESRPGRGLRRIVVDAGHGGKDPGAVGPGGTREKDVTLAMAKALGRELESQLGCEVILTRSGDTFLELPERTAIANKVGADLFISIHANANKNRSARGIETYYLNFSKSDDALEVVARENKTSLEQVGDLELILLDLLANSKINESSRLAAEIQKSMTGQLRKHYKVKDLGVRQGPFYVLLGATMPSVLVETAFISNRTEEKLLVNRKYQQRTASAIVGGVRKYATALKLLASQ